MDLPSAFKSELFRPLATIMVPGATAVAPYAVLANHYNPELVTFAHTFPSVYATALIVAALAAGMILEDFGSMIEVQIWDRLIERETRCHTSDWTAFLALAPRRDEEKVGHRYLRTLTLRLKFQLAFALALVFLWFGLAWLDAVKLLWRQQSVLLLSMLTLGAASYSLWESYRTAWALGGVRHVILTGADCGMEPRQAEVSRLARGFDYAVVVSSVVFIAFATMLGAFHLWPGSPLEHRGGLVTASLFGTFGVVMFLTTRWLRDKDAIGRKRGVALRLSLSTALLGVFVVVRNFTGDRPASPIALVLAIVTAAAMLVFARAFWVREDPDTMAKPTIFAYDGSASAPAMNRLGNQGSAPSPCNIADPKNV